MSQLLFRADELVVVPLSPSATMTKLAQRLVPGEMYWPADGHGIPTERDLRPVVMDSVYGHFPVKEQHDDPNA